jgi:uncharacterized protein (TIRG00374 family)
MVTTITLIFILSQIDMTLFVDAWRTARYEFIIPTIIFLLLGLVTRALRWQVLLNGSLVLHRAFSIMNVAYLVNGVLPLRLGEVARVYLTTRLPKPIPVLTTTSTIIVERLLDLLAVVMLMSLALATGNVPTELRFAGGVSAIIALTGFLSLIFLANRRTMLTLFLGWLQKQVPLFERFSMNDWLDQFLDGLQPILQAKSLLFALFWTTISWTFSVIAGYFLMFAFFPEGSWATTALYIAAAAFAIALPAVPGNIGTYEASILLALSAMGYPTGGASIAFAVMVHAVNVFVHTATGLVGFVHEGISLNQLSTGIQQMQSTT